MCSLFCQAKHHSSTALTESCHVRAFHFRGVSAELAVDLRASDNRTPDTTKRIVTRFSAVPVVIAFVFSACSAPDSSRLPAAHAARPVDSSTHADPQPASEQPSTKQVVLPEPAAAGTAQLKGDRAPNLMGRIPVLEYHLIGETDGRWQRSIASFKRDLAMLYERGYRPVSVSDLVDKRIDLPAGMSPVVFTFDDASPSQFRYVEQDGELIVDPNSAVGIWLEFRKTHPDWSNRAVFCMLSGAEAGRSFFGDKGIEGQKTEWRHRKLRFLAEQGFELCNHTVWHANLNRQSDATVVEQIARLNLAIDSAVSNYRVRTFALPLGEWPKQKQLAHTGTWKDSRSGRAVNYKFDAILQVSGGLSRSPHDPAFDPLRIPRFQVLHDELAKMLDQLERNGQRYVSAGVKR
jgi:hypothetical protein